MTTCPRLRQTSRQRRPKEPKKVPPYLWELVPDIVSLHDESRHTYYLSSLSTTAFLIRAPLIPAPFPPTWPPLPLAGPRRALAAGALLRHGHSQRALSLSCSFRRGGQLAARQTGRVCSFSCASAVGERETEGGRERQLGYVCISPRTWQSTVGRREWQPAPLFTSPGLATDKGNSKARKGIQPRAPVTSNYSPSPYFPHPRRKFQNALRRAESGAKEETGRPLTTQTHPFPGAQAGGAPPDSPPPPSASWPPCMRAAAVAVRWLFWPCLRSAGCRVSEGAR